MRVLRALLLLALVALPVLASQEGAEAARSHSQSLIQLLAPYVNFAVLVGILLFLLKKPMADFLVEKREAITKMLEDSETARDAAIQRMNELQVKLQSLEGDMDIIRKNAQAEALAEKDRLIAEAHEEARRILSAAEKEISNRYTVAVRDLKTYVVTEAVAQAENIVKERLKDDSHEKLIDSYLDRLSKN